MVVHSYHGQLIHLLYNMYSVSGCKVACRINAPPWHYIILLVFASQSLVFKPISSPTWPFTQCPNSAMAIILGK